jgi:hypothetical protein
MNDICVVVQGVTKSDFVKSLKDKFKNIPLIFSTWEDADRTLYEEKDIVLYNQHPLDYGPLNFQLQRISSLNGFLKAKELGFKRVIKWRCDLEPNNADELIKLFDTNYINFYAFVQHQEGYLTDFFMEGNIDDMIALFSITDNPLYPEFGFTKQMYDLGLDKKANFILKKLTKDNNILFKHASKHYWMTEHQTLDHFTDKLPDLFGHKHYTQ